MAKQTLPSLPAFGWTTLLAALVMGLLVGNRLAPRIDPAVAMRLVVSLAMAGALIVLLRGLTSLN